ncbi:MAG: hypothetical protein K2L87_07600 [Clostridiales bacterium]|nr:hypothetical protein [Clostridiales bacterium]
MAKKRHERTERQARNSLVNLCAFVALFLAALLYVLGPIMNWLGLGTLAGILNMIASYALLIAIAFPAWNYVCYKRKVWRICYWVALVIYILGVMFGFIGPLWIFK